MTQRALHPVAPARQFFTLCLRMLYVIFSDRGYSIFIIGLPLALALLSHAVPGTHGLGPDPKGFGLEAQRVLVVLVIGAAFMGIADRDPRDRQRELDLPSRTRDRPVTHGVPGLEDARLHHHRRRADDHLHVPVALGRPGPTEGLVFKKHPVTEIVMIVALVAITSTTIGLLASALVRTTGADDADPRGQRHGPARALRWPVRHRGPEGARDRVGHRPVPVGLRGCRGHHEPGRLPVPRRAVGPPAVQPLAGGRRPRRAHRGAGRATRLALRRFEPGKG